MNLENMLSERSQTQKATYCMIPSKWKIQNRQIHEQKADCLPGPGGEVTANVYGVAFGGR